MADFWGLFGIVVSVGLFVIGYRQTVGAKKERVFGANQEVEKVLVRRIVLEGYTPDVSGVARLLEGKARDFRVRPADLLSEEQVLNSIFTRIIETDFLPQDKREEILKRLVPVIVQAEREPAAEGVVPVPELSRRRLVTRTVALGVMGVLTSAIGTLVAALPTLANLDTDFPRLFPAMIATATASAAIITALIAFYRFRESQQEVASKAEAMATFVGFERDVMDLLRKTGAMVQGGTHDEGYDFSVDHAGRKILLELKAWNRPMPARLIMQIAERLRRIVAREHASEAIIVTPTALNVPHEVIGQGVRIMTLRDLRNYLIHARSN